MLKKIKNATIIFNNEEYKAMNIYYEEYKIMFGFMKSVEFDFLKDGKLLHKKFVSQNIEIIE